jgi:hypothetical protein
MGDPRDILKEQATPSLAEVLREAIENHMVDVHTAMPGRVVKYYPEDQTADIQPCFKRKYYGEDEAVTIPVIPRVPVNFTRTDNAWVKFHLKKDDYVELVFQERSMDKWFPVGGTVDPIDSRMHDLSDAVAYPGMFPRNKRIQPKGAEDSLEIAYGETWVEITSAGKVRIARGNVEVLDILNSLLSTLQSATVLNPTSGPQPFSPSVVTALAQLQTKLSNILA